MLPNERGGLWRRRCPCMPSPAATRSSTCCQVTGTTPACTIRSMAYFCASSDRRRNPTTWRSIQSVVLLKLAVDRFRPLNTSRSRLKRWSPDCHCPRNRGVSGNARRAPNDPLASPQLPATGCAASSVRRLVRLLSGSSRCLYDECHTLKLSGLGNATGSLQIPSTGGCDATWPTTPTPATRGEGVLLAVLTLIQRLRVPDRYRWSSAPIVQCSIIMLHCTIMSLDRPSRDG